MISCFVLEAKGDSATPAMFVVVGSGEGELLVEEIGGANSPLSSSIGVVFDIAVEGEAVGELEFFTEAKTEVAFGI